MAKNESFKAAGIHTTTIRTHPFSNQKKLLRQTLEQCRCPKKFIFLKKKKNPQRCKTNSFRYMCIKNKNGLTYSRRGFQYILGKEPVLASHTVILY